MSNKALTVVSTFVAVPGLLFSLDALSMAARGRTTEFLLVPPLAVIIFMLFSQPDARNRGVRAVVALPVLAAIIGEACYWLFGLTPWGVAIASAVVLLLEQALRSTMPPALAVAILAMLLHAQGPYYPMDVAVSTAIVLAAFHLWRGLVWRRFATTVDVPPGGSSKPRFRDPWW